MFIWAVALILIPMVLILMIFAINNVCLGIANKHNRRSLYLLKSMAYGTLCVGSVFVSWYVIIRIVEESGQV